MTKLYTTGQYVDFLEQVFGKGRSVGAGKDLLVICPVCKELKEKHSARSYTNQKLSINILGKQGVCNCWVCGYKAGGPIHLLKKYFPEHLDSYLDKFLDAEQLKVYKDKKAGEPTDDKPVVVSLPQDFILLATADPRDSYIKWARNYLKARGALSDDMLWYWRMGVSKGDTATQNRIIIPSFDSSGRLNYYSARAMKKREKEKYKNPLLVLRENIVFNELNIDWKSELVIVEGVFDLVKCTDNATALLGSELPGHFLLFEKIVENKTPVVLAMDPEAQNKAYRIAKRLTEFGISVRILKLSPGQEDVGSITRSEFNKHLERAKLFNMEYLLRSKICDLV